MTTEKKSLAVQILTILVLLIGAFTGLFSQGAQAWLGILSMGLTLTLSTFFPSGTFPKNWTSIMWLTNITGVIMQLLNAIGSQGLVEAQTINFIIIAINVFLQTVIKQYDAKTAN